MFTSLTPEPFQNESRSNCPVGRSLFFYGGVIISYPEYQSLQIRHSSHGWYIIGLAKCHSQKGFRSLLLLCVFVHVHTKNSDSYKWIVELHDLEPIGALFELGLIYWVRDKDLSLRSWAIKVNLSLQREYWREWMYTLVVENQWPQALSNTYWKWRREERRQG